MKNTSLTIKVGHENTEGRLTYWTYFNDLLSACHYAVSHAGKIAYNLPMVVKEYTTYDFETQMADTKEEILTEAQIRIHAATAEIRYVEGN